MTLYRVLIVRERYPGTRKHWAGEFFVAAHSDKDALAKALAHGPSNDLYYASDVEEIEEGVYYTGVRDMSRARADALRALSTENPVQGAK